MLEALQGKNESVQMCCLPQPSLKIALSLCTSRKFYFAPRPDTIQDALNRFQGGDTLGLIFATFVMPRPVCRRINPVKSENSETQNNISMNKASAKTK